MLRPLPSQCHGLLEPESYHTVRSTEYRVLILENAKRSDIGEQDTKFRSHKGPQRHNVLVDFFPDRGTQQDENFPRMLRLLGVSQEE